MKPMTRDEAIKAMYQAVELWKIAVEKNVLLQAELKDCQCKK